MTEKYIVSQENQNFSSYYQDHTTSLRLVKEYLKKEFKKEFNVIEANSMEWSMFHGDYSKHSEDVKFLTKITEGFSEVTMLIDRDEEDNPGEKHLKSPFTNGVYYYKEFEVAIASIYKFTNKGIDGQEYIFFADKEKYFAFYELAKERSTMLDEKQIFVFTDTSRGMKRDKQKVNSLIDRSQVVLDSVIKEDIYASVDQFFKESNDFYHKFNIPYKRGILLYGEPGNGKTTLVKSLVGSLDAPVVYWQINEYTTSESVTEVFNMVGSLSPAVLVIEDLDTMPPGTRSTFLNTLDGATTKEGTFLIGTTNYPERIDKALINRVGRFDRTYEIELPHLELRKEYLIMRGMLEFTTSQEIENIASQTEGFSFVQLSEVFRELAYDHYNGRTYNAEKIIKALQDNNAKAKTQKWKASKETPLGFTN